ncbi:MAG: hypothetical protein Q4B17_00155 [Lautropia sp.]|nr:hypothetical protein [Lautropia sp.]
MSTDSCLPSASPDILRRPATTPRPAVPALLLSALVAGSLLSSLPAQADDGPVPGPGPAGDEPTEQTTPASPLPQVEVTDPATPSAPPPTGDAGEAAETETGKQETLPATSVPADVRPDMPATPDTTGQPAAPISVEAQTPPAREDPKPVPIPESGLPAQPRGSPNSPAARPPAAPDTAGTAQQIRHCQVPASLLPPPIKLPGLSGALVRNQQDVLVIVLGAEAVSTNDGGARGIRSLGSRARAREQRIPLGSRLQTRLGHDLGPLVQQRLKVESVGKPHSTVAEQAALIGKQILPRKPALVVWNLGLSDVSRGQPPARLARALDRGLAQLRKQRIDTIVVDLPFHPQYEALYRTDDYRQYIRWTMNSHDQPFLRRFDMVDYWDSTGRIDLDSTEPERQAAAGMFIDTCVAYQLSQMIDKALN